MVCNQRALMHHAASLWDAKLMLVMWHGIQLVITNDYECIEYCTYAKQHASLLLSIVPESLMRQAVVL